MSGQGKLWSDAEIIAAMRRELIGFGSDELDAKAIAEARERWGLFERLRAIEGDFSAWADLPSQEAFEPHAQREFRSLLDSGAIFEREADSLPADQAPSLLSCAPVAAAGQSSSKSSQGLGFAFEPPSFDPAPGSEELALEALDLGIQGAVSAVSEGRMSAARLRSSFLARAARLEPSIRAMESSCQGPLGDALPTAGPLAGMPFAAKSLFWVRGELASASCAMLSKFRAPIDAPVVAGLKSAGAWPMGMARMDELAMGGDGSRSRWGSTSHPSFPGRSPGGSSSGSAAALAAGLCMFSIGSDTGGSVRIPASHCGLWGMKPTYGSLSRFGMVPYAFSLDCPASFARSASDLACIHEAMASGPAGWDARQKLWSSKGFAARAVAKGESMARRGKPWEGVRIGVEARMLAGVDACAKEAFEDWSRKARGLGARLVEIELPSASKAVWAYYLLASCEAQSSIARYDPVRFGWDAQASGWPDWESAALAARSLLLGREPKLRALMGAMALGEPSRASLYAKACGLRAALASEWAMAFASVDFVAMPTTAGPAPELGQDCSAEVEWAQDRLAIPASLGGICALSAPWAMRSDGFPMGIQICGRWHGESDLLALCMGAKGRL